ncbi:sugar ABC transporter permease [Lacrimispora amygdalina]|uniref:Sugar ABC transporter permease n=1 Tax=Lacrimispora amygdalina TaxID=253257 RepID=A0A3E2NEY0_9FIRM|nr:sugar ABC transporter permease [Clostridium indicum]RFZ79579.1 sugar ABC transporter permease [Clostridium indicum]
MVSNKQLKTGSARKRKIRDHLVAYSFIAPNFIGFAVFTLVPMLFSFVLSLMEWDGGMVNPMKFTGIQNYLRLFADSKFQNAYWNTLVYTLGYVPLTLVLSLLLAIVLNAKIRGRNFFRTLSFFPYVASIVAVASVWNMLFNPSMGPVNMLLSALGIENLPRWSADKNWAMITVILFSVWKSIGYYMIIFLAGLQGINADLYEAASLDGAGKWKQFLNVTLPQLKPTTFFVVVMLTIGSFKVYDQIFLITQGGPGDRTMVLVYYIYNQAFKYSDYGYASTVSIVLFLTVLAVTLIQFRGEKKYANS